MPFFNSNLMLMFKNANTSKFWRDRAKPTSDSESAAQISPKTDSEHLVTYRSYFFVMQCNWRGGAKGIREVITY